MKTNKYKLIVFDKKFLDMQELDWESDLKDLVCQKVKTEKFKEVTSDWDDDKFIIVIKIEN